MPLEMNELIFMITGLLTFITAFIWMSYEIILSVFVMPKLDADNEFYGKYPGNTFFSKKIRSAQYSLAFTIPYLRRKSFKCENELAATPKHALLYRINFYLSLVCLILAIIMLSVGYGTGLL